MRDLETLTNNQGNTWCICQITGSAHAYLIVQLGVTITQCGLCLKFRMRMIPTDEQHLILYHHFLYVTLHFARTLSIEACIATWICFCYVQGCKGIEIDLAMAQTIEA